MARPGPAKGIVLTQQHREKIAKSQVLTALMEHTLGKRDMSSTQVQAGIALMRKVLPDLSSAELTGETVQHFVAWLPQQAASVEDWRAQYALPAPTEDDTEH